jgi:hypothetical protein
MEPSTPQFPQSLSGFKARYHNLPETTKDFSDAALAGHKKTKVSPSVTVIEPRGGVISAMPQKAYNQASTDLINMRKSGEAAKYDAETTKFRNDTSFSPWKKEKQTVKIDSGKAK